MYRADYHMHTNLSPDSKVSIDTQIQKAIREGFQEIAITDHYEYDLMDEKWQLTMDIDHYIQTVEEAKSRYKDQIIIKTGVEIGYEAMYHDQLNMLIRDKIFDFIICSTHKCEHQELYFGGFFIGKTQDEAYRGYFEHVLEAVTHFEHFNVYGHLDYVNRYGEYPVKILDTNKYGELIDAILETLIRKDKGLEINTSGIRYGLGHFNPQIPVLKRYLEKGGEIITIGSDSHYEAHTGYLWDEAAKLLKNIGFRAYTTFDKGKPLFHQL